MTEATMETALSVLRETVGKRPSNAIGISPTGTRLIALAGMFGYNGRRARISLQEVVQLSAAMICLDVISQDIAKVTLRLYEMLGPGAKREVMANEHPIAELLNSQPNQFHTWYEFKQMVLLHMGILQNAYIAKRIMRDGTIEELIPCMPARTTMLAVEAKNGKGGFFAYDVQRLSPQERIMFGGLPEVFLPDQFIHLRTRMMDGLMGYSNLEAGAKSFGLANEIIEYQTRLYRNDGQLRGVFQKPGGPGDTLSEPAYNRLKDDLEKMMSRFRAENRPIVLEEGMTFQEIAMNAEQSEISAARDSAIVDMARTFRVPPHKMMHLVNVKYENMETLEKSYVQDSLIPYCKPVEQKLNIALLRPEDRSKYFLEFDRKEMLLNDAEKLAEVLETLAKYGAIDTDEFRAPFGFNPMPNGSGKVRMVPSTYNVVNDKNEVVIPAGAQPADKGNGEDEKKPAAKPKPKKEAEDTQVFEFPTLIGAR